MRAPKVGKVGTSGTIIFDLIRSSDKFLIFAPCFLSSISPPSFRHFVFRYLSLVNCRDVIMLKALSLSTPADDIRNHIPEENPGDNQESLGSHHDVQPGVHNIEAISQTWTQWSLISAYVG